MDQIFQQTPSHATYGSHARTALHLAAKKGDEPMVDLLTTYKPYNCEVSACRPGLVDDNGRTALHYAASNNHSGVIELLVYAGAKVNGLWVGRKKFEINFFEIFLKIFSTKNFLPPTHLPSAEPTKAKPPST